MPDENVKAPETNYHAYTEVFTPQDGWLENQDFIITKVGSTKKSLEKFELGFIIPNVAKCSEADMSLKDFFDQDVFTTRNLNAQDAIIQLFRKLTTAPGYEICFDKKVDPVRTADPTLTADKKAKPDFVDYPPVENAHTKMQELADGFELGRKASESAVEKAKLKADQQKLNTMNQLMTDQGIDVENFDEVKAAIAAMVAKKKGKK